MQNTEIQSDYIICPKCKGCYMEYDEKLEMYHCIQCGKVLFKENKYQKPKIYCEICGREVERGRGNKKYCSKCAYEIHLKRMHELYRRKKGRYGNKGF